MKLLSKRRPVAALCLFLAMVYFTSYITRLNYNAAMAAIIEDGTLTKPQAGGIGSALFFAYGFGQLVSGMLGDHFRPNRIMTVGLGLTALCNALMPAVSSNSIWMMVIWGINGFAQAMMWPPMIKLMSSYMDEDEFANCNWLVSIAAHAATILIYIVVPVCITRFHWRAAFLLASALAVIVMLAWSIGYRSLTDKLTEREVSSPKKVGEGRSGIHISLGHALVVSGTLFLLIGVAMQGFLKDGVQSWLPIFFTEVFRMESSTAVLSNMALPIFNILIVSVATWLYRKVFRNEVRAALTFFCVAVVLSMLLAFFYQSSAVLCLILAALITGSMHGINLVLISFLPRRFAATGRVATVSGLLNACSYAGSCISSYGIALVAETMGWQTTLFSWSAVALVGVSLCALSYRRWARFVSSTQKDG